MSQFCPLRSRRTSANLQLNRVTLIPGDGVGKEITQSVEEIFEVSSQASIKTRAEGADRLALLSAPMHDSTSTFPLSLSASTSRETRLRMPPSSSSRWTRSSATRSDSRVRLRFLFLLVPTRAKLGSLSTRYPLHPRRALGSHLVERRHAPATRHLRFPRPLQVGPRLPHPSPRRRLCHHS